MTEKNDFDSSYQSLAELLLLLNFNYDEFYKNLRKFYVLAAYEQCRTITQTSLKTGVDRRIVADIVKNKRRYYRPSSLSLILMQIKKLAKKNQQKVNKTGQQSVFSIMQDVAPGASTVNAIVKELVDLGHIEDCGDHIIYINNPPKSVANKELQRLSTHLQRYINTFAHNLNCPYPQQKKLDCSIFSTRVPAVLAQSLENCCRELLIDVTADLLKIFETYEQKIAYDSYQEIGVCMFQFNLNPPA